MRLLTTVFLQGMAMFFNDPVVKIRFLRYCLIMKTILLTQGGWINRTSGVRGVYFHKQSKKWIAHFMKDRKETFVGYFESASEAQVALELVRPPLPKQTAIVDDQDYEYVSQFNWHLMKNGYVSRCVVTNGKKTLSYLHREILERMGFSLSRKHTDHISGDKLDNRRLNLRPATVSENGRNSKLRKTSLSGIKGVNRSRNKWRARIYLHGKDVWVRYFSTKEEAAAARAEVLPLYHGEFARC